MRKVYLVVLGVDGQRDEYLIRASNNLQAKEKALKKARQRFPASVIVIVGADLKG